MRFGMPVLLVLLVLLACLGSARATWPSDPTVNLVVTRSRYDQIDVVATTDGAGGALLAWWDYRNSNCDVYGSNQAFLLTVAGIIGISVVFVYIRYLPLKSRCSR